jgi:hypothetical protein
MTASSVPQERRRFASAPRRLVVFATLLGTVPQLAGACEPSVGIMPPFRFAADRAFIGTPESDTILAGAGGLKYETSVADSTAGSRGIYGQLVRVSKTSHWPAADRKALERSGGEVVLVRWEVSSLCGPVKPQWTARAFTPGVTGLYFDLAPRTRAYWVGGRPTFDFVLSKSPYTSIAENGAGSRIDSRGATREQWLTPAELLELYETLPFAGSLAGTDTTYSEYAPLLTWVRNHSVLAQRPPVPGIVEDALRMAEYSRVHSIASPVAGTYHFVVTMQGDSAQFFLRTASTPYDEIPPDYDVPPLPGLQSVRTIGYTLMVRGALTAAALATTRYTHAGVPTEINVAVRELPIEVTADSTVWAANFDVLPIAQAVSPRVAAHLAALARLPKSHSDAESQSLAWTPPSLSGRFLRSRDGGMRFEQTMYTGAGRVIVVRGERISKMTLKKARGEQ